MDNALIEIQPDKDRTKKITQAFILSNGKMVDAKYLSQAEVKSNQSEEIQSSKTEDRENNTAVPPYNQDYLASIYEKSTTHFRSVNAKADDTVSRGWNIVFKTGQGSEKNRQALIDKLNAINPTQTLGTILHNALVDYEAIGNGYIEIAREKAQGMVSLLNHIPANTIRITKDMEKYVHQRGNKKVFFKRWGDTRKMDKNTGEFGASVEFINEANELVPMLKYHPRSDYYGIPDVIPALGAVLGDLNARDYNLDFFANGAIPAYAVVIEGADVTEPLKEAIEAFFRHQVKGLGNQHRTIIMPIPAEGVKIRFEKLSVDVKEGSFKLYRQENRDEILSAHGVPPVRAMLFTSGALGRDVSADLDKIYQETTIRTNIEMVERIMNSIIQEGMGIKDLAFKLNRIRFTDIAALGSFVSAVVQSKSLTVNELREMLSPLFENGLDKIDGGDTVWIDVAGVPTPLDEIFTTNPDGAGDDADTKRVLGHKMVEYDDVDIDTIGQMNREYEGAKDTEIRSALGFQAPVVNETADALMKVYDKILRDVYAELRSQGSKGWFRLFTKAATGGGVNMNPVLKAIDKHQRDFQEVLEDSYKKSIVTGAKYSAKRLNANIEVSGKAFVTIPDAQVTIKFDLRNPTVEKFVREQSERISFNLTKTMSNRVRNQMLKGIERGETNEEIAERLEETVGVPGLRDSAGRLITADVRSKMIARTEVADAFNVGSLLGFKESGVVQGVEVRDGDDFDEPCRQANGAEWSFRKAEDNSLEHPNCTRIFIPLVKE